MLPNKEAAPIQSIPQTPFPEVTTVLKRGPILACPRFRGSPVKYAIERMTLTGRRSIDVDHNFLKHYKLPRGRSGRSSLLKLYASSFSGSSGSGSSSDESDTHQCMSRITGGSCERCKKVKGKFPNPFKIK